jgi:predicted transcriptional regulator
MLSTAELVALAKKQAGDVTDYRLAKILGISHSTVSSYQNGRSKPENPVAMRLAELAGIDPVAAMAAVNIERATSDGDRQAWELILARCAH